MNANDFCFWLRGYFEIDGQKSRGLTNKQVTVIKEHLDKVFAPVVTYTNHTGSGATGMGGAVFLTGGYNSNDGEVRVTC